MQHVVVYYSRLNAIPVYLAQRLSVSYDKQLTLRENINELNDLSNRIFVNKSPHSLINLC